MVKKVDIRNFNLKKHKCWSTISTRPVVLKPKEDGENLNKHFQQKNYNNYLISTTII